MHKSCEHNIKFFRFAMKQFKITLRIITIVRSLNLKTVGHKSIVLPYSPNLNPIERLWKIINEFARNNRVFKRASKFRQAINEFFDKWPEIGLSKLNRINNNFQTFNTVSSR